MLNPAAGRRRVRPPLCALSCCSLLLANHAHGWEQWTQDADGPGLRAGHSLSLWGDEALILFGGQGLDQTVIHDPRTYQLGTVNGSLTIVDYTGQQVRTCGPNVSFTDCYSVQTGVAFNDVWMYPLVGCTSAVLDEAGCPGASWVLLAPGAALGGCQVENGTEVCTHPFERSDHGAAVFSADDTLMVYGGVSTMCEDYCSDAWTLNLSACVAALGGSDAAAAAACAWVRAAVLGRQEPGNRWAFSHAMDAAAGEWVLFGGNRLWQGFGAGNSLGNHWNNTAEFPYGGYLDDMWVVTWTSFGDPEAGGDTGRLAWRQVTPYESCFSQPGSTWEQRNDVICSVLWPHARAFAALAVASAPATGALNATTYYYLHGGYSVGFPYPQLLGKGSALGGGSLASDGPAPYPVAPYFYDDLWRFDVGGHTWAQLSPLGGATPAARRGHSLVALSASVLHLHGGYGKNVWFGDTWLFNASNRWWLPRETGVLPLFPPNCTSDVVPLSALPLFPSGGGGAGAGDGALGQPGFLLYGGVDLGGSLGLGVLALSVAGEPTRGQPLDGLAGRAAAPVWVPQPRRQAPGWDGCRDRVDGRADLPPELQWASPAQRARHAAVYAPQLGALLLYGGESPAQETAPSISASPAAGPVGGLWAWRPGACPFNCSGGNGVCAFGLCQCTAGWFGLDCSNATCPGDFCSVDPNTQEQVCSHCCSAGYAASDADVPAVDGSSWGTGYQPAARKLPCSAARPGASQGICDGFGTCQCAPPFLGPDCSIRDCPNSCSGTDRGVCSVEYPVSRCLCKPPFSGPDCSLWDCPNNCSYPQGTCDTATGQCACTWVLSPFNRTQLFLPFDGPDCSYVTMFAGAEGRGALGGGGAGAGLLAASVLLLWRCYG